MHPVPRFRAIRGTLVACLLMGCAGELGELGALSGLGELLGEPAGNSRVVAGLKEALAVGTRQAVDRTSRPGGFLDHPRLRIGLPDALDPMAQGLRLVGYGPQLDALGVAMNRGAERAAAEASEVFLAGIRQMSFDDAMGILNGGDTAATAFFERTTRDTLFQRFEPIVVQKLGQVGAVRQYDQLVRVYEAVPLAEKPDLDLGRYVTHEALDGLFAVLGEEERKIRTDPAARVTPLLREVFGR